MKATICCLIFIFYLNDHFSQHSLSPPLASLDAGFYDSTITVSLSAAQPIFYTLDGSEPNVSSLKYVEKLKISKTTVLRACCINEGKSGTILTNTYFIGRRHNLPTISLSTHPDNFFSEEKGIYVKGCCAEKNPPYNGANFWKGWEHPIHFEFFENDGNFKTEQDLGVRIFGGYSKGLPMKSLALFAKKKYQSTSLDYPFFPNRDITSFKSIVLRSSGSDFNMAHYRDALLTNLTEPIGLDIQASRPVVVYINGAYWGIHNMREKITEHYLASHHPVHPDNINLLKHRYDVQTGNKSDYIRMLNFIEKSDFSDIKNIRKLNTMMDIDNYLSYNITQVYIDNEDAGGNIRFWKSNEPGSKWRWILFDLDLSFGIANWKAYKNETLFSMTTPSEVTWPYPSWSTLIIRKLLENDSIKTAYINKCADFLNSIYAPKTVIAKIDSIHRIYEYEMPYHLQKWTTSGMKNWHQQKRVLEDFARHRPFYLRDQLKRKFDLGDTCKVSLAASGLGKVHINNLISDTLCKAVYFVGQKIKITAIPNFGYDFIGWLENVDLIASDSIILTGNITLTAAFIKKSKSNYCGKVYFSELSLMQDELELSGDWIEIYNGSNDTIELKNWSIKNIYGENYKIKSKVKLLPDSYIVARESWDLFESIFPNSPFIPDTLTFGILSSGDSLFLYDNLGRIVDSLIFNTKKHFPGLDTLKNKNIVKIRTDTLSLPEAWKIQFTPTPGSYKVLPKQKLKNNSAWNKNIIFLLIASIPLIILIIFAMKFRKKKN